MLVMGDHGRSPTHRAAGDVLVRDGCVHWHTRYACDVRDAREGIFAYGCSLQEAWTSCLLPCPSCAGAEAALAANRWGGRTRVERARLSLPVLQGLVSGVTIVPSSTPGVGARRMWPLQGMTEVAPVGRKRSRVATRGG